MSIPVVLPPDWIARLNDLSTRRGMSRSALVREALERSLWGDLGLQGIHSGAADTPKGAEIPIP